MRLTALQFSTGLERLGKAEHKIWMNVGGKHLDMFAGSLPIESEAAHKGF